MIAAGEVRFAGFMVGAFVLAWLLYEKAIERVVAWGEMVKAAFDRYLPDLAKALGYELPDTKEDQFAFWEAVQPSCNLKLTI